MKEKSSSSGLSALFGEDESLVADILLQLPSLISEHESPSSGYKFPITWGSKGRRSAIGSRRPLPLPCSSSSPPGAHTDADRPPPTLKVKALSPATPLSFSSSESEDQPNPSNSKRKRHAKTKKERWLARISELTKHRDSLKGEVETVNRYYEELKAFNLKLKARKHQLTPGAKMEAVNVGGDQGLNFVNMEMGVPSMRPPPAPTDRIPVEILAGGLPQSSSVIKEDHAARRREMSENVEYTNAASNSQIPYTSVVSGSGIVNNDSGSRVVLDLNVSAEEPNNVTSSAAAQTSFHLDTAANKEMSKAMAAQARWNRIQICRGKNPVALGKLRYR